ncbi:hypothetical protein [uncultured Bacteroides sp.]|nr:hypothetical protein [uncultured Bacteroides sp.]MCY6331011.1 hypothetical protein [Bacteroides fragilis]
MVTITISIRPCLAAYLYVQPPRDIQLSGTRPGVPYRQSLRRFLEEYGME